MNSSAARALPVLMILALVVAGHPAAVAQEAAAGPCEGWTTRVVASGLGMLENLHPDGEGGLLLSSLDREAVERLAPDGTITETVVADITDPGGLRIRDGILYANQGDSIAGGLAGDGSGTLERIDLATGTRTTVADGFSMPNGLVLDDDGNAYISRTFGTPSTIARVPLDDGAAVERDWADLADTNGMIIDPTGTFLYVATTINQPASVFKIRLDDPTDITEVAQLSGVGNNLPKGLDDLDIDADGVLYITANGSGEVLRLDPSTGEACQITDALQNPTAVKFGAGPGWPADRLYVTAFDGRVVELSPPAGASPGGDGPAEEDGTTRFTDFSCSGRSWVAGTTELCGGVLTHRDYVYDDYGADLGTRATSTGTLAVPAGDVRYPAAGPHNTADLVDLSLRIVGDRLEVLAEVNALYDTGSTVLAVAIDTDDDPATGGGEWPGLGISSDGWDVMQTFSDADPLANLIGGSMALPGGQTWRLQAVVAQANGDDAVPPTADGVDHAVMNVAFRGPDEVNGFTFLQTSPPEDGAWFEDLQAAALLEGDITPFGLTVDVDDIRTAVVATIEPVGPGLHERVYTSDVTLPPGEGMDYAGIRGRGTGGPSGAFGQIFHYYGRYQPYGLFLPDPAAESVQAPHGLMMTYHGSNQNHSQLVNLPGFQRQVGTDNNRILAAPLARGVHGYGSDISERDVQDVYADVIANHDIDLDDVHASGYSQGGYVTFRQAALHPDTFASFTTWVGFTGDDTNPASVDGVTAGAVGNMFDFVGNYRHIPGAMIYGGADELVQVSSSEAMGNQFRTRDFPYRFYMHPMGDHFVFALLDEWGKESAYTAGRTRVTDPARVVFRTAEVLGRTDVGARHDEAYWVSQLRGRETVDDPFAAEDAYVDVDLTAAGCGDTEPEVELAGDAGPSPIPWVSDGNEPVGDRIIAPAPSVTGSLANVSSLVIDVEATCLADRAVDVAVTSDGPAVLRFSDGRRLTLMEGDTTATVPVTDDRATVRLAGPDRIDTAIAVSQEVRDSAPTVVLATAADYADALAAGPLAALRDAPLLLTGGTALDSRVAEEVRRLGATEVLLVGGEAVLSPAVADGVASTGATATRVAGPDRFATAAAVADAVVAAGGDGSAVYLVEGADADPARGWPDAVAASGLAARQGRPILLATTDVVPAPTLAALDRLGTSLVTVVGGQAAITDRTLAMAADPDDDGPQIGAVPGGVSLHRIAGVDRYSTSAQVADRTLDALATTDEVWIVTGANWPDALTAGPAAAASGGVLLLADGGRGDGGATAAAWAAANAPIERTVLVGGLGVLAGLG